MLDVVLVFTWSIAMTRSLRWRGWFPAACGVVIAYLWLVAFLGVSAAVHGGQIARYSALGLVFLGVTFVGGNGRPGVPGSIWAAKHPAVLLLIMGIVALGAAAHAFRRAAGPDPSSPNRAAGMPSGPHSCCSA